MSKISIREQTSPESSENFTASVLFDDTDQFDGISISDPLTERDRFKLEWHFEQFVQTPYLSTVEPFEAQKIIQEEGETLFSEIFNQPEIKLRYQQAIGGGFNNLTIEIIGSPEFHSLHWEALKDPRFPRPLALDAQILRKDTRPQALPARLAESATINLLIVTSRPRGRRDVGYRTISRPLVELLRNSQLPVKVHILRPATYRALSDHLNENRNGFYHVVHFDVHGALLSFDQFNQFEGGTNDSNFLFQASRWGRPQLEPFDGSDAFLFFDLYREPEKTGDDGFRPDPVRANELADLLLTHGIPLIILNACQSAKQLGEQDAVNGLPIVHETSLASRLMRAGAQSVLAMSYSVTVTAAEIMMKRLYKELFRGKTFQQAVQAGRRDLANTKSRRAAYNRRVSLEDWLLPVVYQKQPLQLKPRKLIGVEEETLLIASRESGGMPEVEYGFHGRDVDVLNIERRVLLKNNILLIRGMGGAGKTTLLQHLAWWWQTTDFVRKVFYFGYDQKAYTRQEIMFRLAEALYDRFEFTDFQAKAEAAQIEKLTRKLRNERHLLILDNLESIQGEFFAIKNTLSQTEQVELKDFLTELRGSAQDFREQANVEQTIVLLGSRSAEEWLAPGTFDENLYDLGGLDRESATQFAEEILRAHSVLQYRNNADFQKLLKLLAGFPLPLKVVLENLKRQSPAEVLAALEAGDVNLESGTAENKTASILKCIEYSHSNIAPEKQELLLCLAPFTSVVNQVSFDQYIEELKKHESLVHLAHDMWGEIFTESVQRGLVSRHEALPVYYLQPTLPWFLRTEMQKAKRSEFRKSVETAFREYFSAVSRTIRQAMNSKDAGEKQLGQFLAKLEFENVETCLRYALDASSSILGPFALLSGYFDTIQDHEAGLRLAERVVPRIEAYPEDVLAGGLGLERAEVLDNLAMRQLLLKKPFAAEESYQKVFEVLSSFTSLDEDQKRRYSASILHQLGFVAREQRDWPKAENYYRRSLEIATEFDDRSSQALTLHELGRVAQEQHQWLKAEEYYQKAMVIKIELEDPDAQASTLHQLGRVAEEQSNWPKAEDYYQQALAIKIEFNDRHSQALTLHQLGSVAAAQGDWRTAEDYYQKALAIKIEFSDRYSQASTLGQLANGAAERGEWLKAAGYYLRVLVIFLEFDDKHKLAVTLSNLRRLWRQSGDEQLLARIGKILGLTQEEVRELFVQVAGENSNENPDTGK